MINIILDISNDHKLMFVQIKIHSSDFIPKNKYLFKINENTKHTNKDDDPSSATSQINMLNQNTNKCVQLIRNQLTNLVEPFSGYLCDLYGVYCENTDWLTGWEISKILYNKIIQNNRNSVDEDSDCFNLCGYFGNTNTNFTNGFLYFMSSLSNERDISHNYFIYGNKMKLPIDESTTKINYIDTVEIDGLKYDSPSICRYVYNHVRRHSLYLNFSITDQQSTCNVSIKSFLHTIMHLNKDHGLCIVAIPWLINFDQSDPSNINSSNIDSSIQMYIFALSCMFVEIQLVWFIWDNKVWAICYQRKDSLSKLKYINLLRSDGYILEKIKKKYRDAYESVLHDILSFHNEISNTKNKILCKMISKNVQNINGGTWSDTETIVRRWLHENEKKLSSLKNSRLTTD